MTTKQNTQFPNKGPSESWVAMDARIREMEEKCDLLQYTVDGWSVWPLLRFSVAREVMHLPVSKPAKQGHWRYSERLVLALRDLPRLLSPRKARYVVRTYNTGLRSDQEKGFYKDLFFDDLLLEIGDYFKIERVSKKHFASRRKSALIKSDITSTALDASARFLARVSGPGYVSNIAADISSCIERELDLTSFPPEKIALILRQFYWSKKLYRWLLARIQPEYLLLTVGYGKHAIMAAAKGLCIQVIEFQHGSVGRHHIGYSWSTYALAYKTQMPIPDRIFLFGDHWKQELELNGFWGESLRSVGNLNMDQYRRRDFRHTETAYTIVVTTQVDIEPLIAFLLEFTKIAEGCLDLCLYIKLHPKDTDKSPFQSAFEGNKHVHILLGNEPPSTLELLARADIHISTYSTCHYEALALGTPTVILPLTGHKVMLSLHEAGHAFLARTPRDLLDIILNHQHYKVPDEVSAFYFKPHAVENMKMELRV